MNTPSAKESSDFDNSGANVTCFLHSFSPARDSVDQLRNLFRKGSSYHQLVFTFPRALSRPIEDKHYADFLRKDIQRIELFLRMEPNLRKDKMEAAKSVLEFRRQELLGAEPSHGDDTVRMMPAARPAASPSRRKAPNVPPSSRLRDTIRYFFGSEQ